MRNDAIEEIENNIPSGDIYNYIHDSFYYTSDDDISSYRSKTINGNIDLVIVLTYNVYYKYIEGIYIKNLFSANLPNRTIEIDIYNDTNGKYVKLSRIEVLGKNQRIYVDIYYK